MVRRILFIGFCMTSVSRGEWVDLWPGKPPGASPIPPGSESVEDHRVSPIERPQYELFPAPEGKRTGKAVVVFPGGGYSFLSMKKEGHDVAAWLNQRGITAMIAKYRVSKNAAHGYQYPVPFLDARRAIRTLRSMSATLGIREVGVMGFSAGGHLASLCATRFGDGFAEETKDEIDAISPRPDFAVLIYPVISMQPIGHSGSRERLLGNDPKPEQVRHLSTSLHVGKATPRCFLLSTADDFVDCRNSLEFATACKTHGVPVTLHLFEKGGHGYGLNGGGELAAWPSLLDAWLKR